MGMRACGAGKLQPPPTQKNWSSSVFWAMTKIWAAGVFGVSNIALIHIERARAQADLGMFSMFGRTGAPTKRGPHRPEIVGRQHDIF